MTPIHGVSYIVDTDRNMRPRILFGWTDYSINRHFFYLHKGTNKLRCLNIHASPLNTNSVYSTFIRRGEGHLGSKNNTHP
jgi:hypothetical protein